MQTQVILYNKYNVNGMASSLDQAIWGRLFEINDVVSKRFVKISNVNIKNMLLFFVGKM